MRHILPQRVRILAAAMLCLLASAFILVACSDPRADFDSNDTKVDYQPTDCDPIDPSMCALPWPSNLYLIDDADTQTGYALQLGETTLPKGPAGHIKPDAWYGMDGYGVSSPILFKAPNLDMSQMPLETDATSAWSGDIGQAQLFEMDAAGTLTRVPFFVERDPRQDAEHSLYYIRPLVILDENARYVVMLRNLTDTDGNPIARSAAFDTLVRDAGYADPELSGRQEHFNEIFDALEAQHDIDRDTLFLAWDFHTASHEALHGPMLKGRELVLNAMENEDGTPGGPEMTITNVTTFQRDDPQGANYNRHIAYELYGTFSAPQIVEPEGEYGYVFHYDDNGELAVYGNVDREFWVRVPYTALEDPAGMIQYGHGLLGRGNQVHGSAFGRTAYNYNVLYFGGNWTGMASPDEGRIAYILNDFSKFRWLSDNMHQGVLEFMELAEAMKYTFPTLQKVQDLGIQVDTGKLYYHGISQGGIYGATYVAVSPDINVGALGVPGINYDFLVQRSVDFDEYFKIALGAYGRNPSNIGIILAAAQTLWDMTDPASYYHHLREAPFPGNDVKHVLLTPAKGDHQVSPLTNLIVANSIDDISVMKGWDADIHVLGPDLEETAWESGKHQGSGIVLWDVGNAWPAPGMIPPQEEKALDPHGVPRYIERHQQQMMHFLQTGGEIIDVCEDKGCHMRKLSEAECSTFDLDGREDDRRCYKLKD